MDDLRTLTYAVGDRVARITLNRPERGNGLTPRLIRELEACVERADLDPAVHVILLSGNGKGFCGGYDLVASAEGRGDPSESGGEVPGSPPGGEVAGSPLDPAVIARNHDPSGTWDPMVDHAMMSRNVRAFMSLFHASTPVVCKVHGFCVAGGTDLALCSDLLVIAEDAKIGYPPARVWGVPTTALWAYRLGPQRAKRLLFTGDSLSGREALEWGLAIEAPPAAQLDERAEILVERIARMPANQLALMKHLVNQSLYSQGLHATQLLGTVFDGIARLPDHGHHPGRNADHSLIVRDSLGMPGDFERGAFFFDFRARLPALEEDFLPLLVDPHSGALLVTGIRVDPDEK
jgi:enoyl-CoA hydratase